MWLAYGVVGEDHTACKDGVVASTVRYTLIGEYIALDIPLT